jgi:CheY-like chemotaxis protein
MEGKRSSLRVLVVEDNEDAAASLGMLLCLYGCEVELAFDGPSACRAVQASPPEARPAPRKRKPNGTGPPHWMPSQQKYSELVRPVSASKLVEHDSKGTGEALPRLR